MIVCLNCGKLNPEGFNYCLECGAEIQPEQAQASESGILAGLSADSPEIQELKNEVSAEQGASGSPASSVAIELQPEATEDMAMHNAPTAKIDPGMDLEEQASVVLEPIEDEPEEIPVQVTLEGNPETVAESAPTTCQNCGAAMRTNDRFCGSCGAAYGKRSTPTEAKTMFMASQEQQETVKPMGRLISLDPSGSEGLVYNLMETTVLGREDCDITITDDPFISPRHCTFTFSEGNLSIQDNDSLNGVYVKIHGEVPLQSGSVFRVGQQALMYVAPRDFEKIATDSPEDGTVYWGAPRENIWGKLVRITNTGGMAEHYLLHGPFLTMGRERGDIVFSTDAFVSGTHARVSLSHDKVILADLNSSNGTYIKITGSTPLPVNSIVLTGRKLFRIEY